MADMVLLHSPYACPPCICMKESAVQGKLEGQELRLQSFTERGDHVRQLTFTVHRWLRVSAALYAAASRQQPAPRPVAGKTTLLDAVETRSDALFSLQPVLQRHSRCWHARVFW